MLKSFGENSTFELVPLKIHANKKNIIVEDIQAEEFYEMSPASVDAINAIQRGVPLREIELSLVNKYPNEDIDINEFIHSLLQLQLITKIDGHTVLERTPQKKVENTEESRWPNAIGKVMFRSPFILLYVIAVVFSLGTLIARPEYIPDLHSMHMFGSMTLNVVVWAGISLFLLALHEFSHFLAARSFDVSAKYGFGHRLYFLVLETDISNVWRLQPKQRLIPYLAGMMNDFVMLSITLALRMFFPEMPDLLYEVLELSGLYLCIMLVFQTFVFMKTDLYYVIETISGTLNLKERTDAWLKSLFHKNRGQEAWFVKVYSVIYGSGLLFSIWLLVTVAYPQFLHFLEHARDYLSYPVTNFYFWDGVLFLIFNGLSLALLFYSWMRKLSGYIRAKRGQSMAS